MVVNEMDETINRSPSFWLRFGIPAVVLAAGALAAYLYYSPLIAIRNMQQAIDRRDAAAVADYVDFPALRENLKNTFTAKLMAGDGSGKDAGLNALAATFGSLLIGKMVEAMVTPEGLAEIMRGEPPRAAKPAAVTKKKAAPPPREPKRDLERTWRYENWDRVVVEIRERGSTEPPTGLVFERHGPATWKLAGIRLPT